MPSMLRTAAVAAFAAYASAQSFVNITFGPINFPGWTYIGCYDVTVDVGFLLDVSPYMTIERCLLECSNYDFAHLSANSCYCANASADLTLVPEASCFTRCPANPTEACGGVPGFTKRQVAGTAASVYARQLVVPAGDVYVTVINNIYIDYCPSCNNGGGGLTTVTYYSTTTLTGCGCKTTPVPTIPMTSTVYPCSLSGTTTTVTLTVPTGVVPGTATSSCVTAPVTTVTACSSCPGGSTTATVSPCPGCAIKTTAVVPVGPVPTTTILTAVVTPTKPAVYTGAAAAVKAGSGLLAGAVAVAALL